MTKQVDGWEHGSEITLGIVEEHDGSFLALTRASSRSFKKREAAVKWLAKLGYKPDGSKY